jgi:hypothetical protein
VKAYNSITQNKIQQTIAKYSSCILILKKEKQTRERELDTFNGSILKYVHVGLFVYKGLPHYSKIIKIVLDSFVAKVCNGKIIFPILY